MVGICVQLPDSPGPERILSLTADDYDTACEVIGRGSNFLNYFWLKGLVHEMEKIFLEGL
jgi:hypothetical protein